MCTHIIPNRLQVLTLLLWLGISVLPNAAYAQMEIRQAPAAEEVQPSTQQAHVLQYRGMPPLREPLPGLVYPAEARKMGVEGRVVVSYEIDVDGNVLEATVERGLGYGCDEEALRVIREARFAPMPGATPDATPMRFVTPIKFVLK